VNLPSTLDVLAEIVARHVATGVEMAKSIGHKMPQHYDVGFKLVDYDHSISSATGTQTRFRIRMADVTYDSVVIVPHFDGRIPLRLVSSMWKDAMQRIAGDALTMANVWLGKHPEARISDHDVKRALDAFDLMNGNEDLTRRWMTECEERAKHANFKKVR
jgi:hypothetical protein